MGGSELLRYGYITNGLADHTLEQGIELLAEAGYQGIGITLDHHHLDPFQVTDSRLAEIGERLRARNLEPVIETGARYALDPQRKHWPSLVSSDAANRQRRVEYYRRAMEIAGAIGAKTVSLWSGVAEKGIDSEANRNHLVTALEEVVVDACASGISIGFEPEPGMVIESLADWRWLREQVTGSALGLTLDLGHLAVTESVPLELSMATVIEDVIHVHVDDCKDGVHQHLEPGAGEIDFDPLLQLLVEQGYSGLALVELSRDSHRAPELIERTIRYLQAVVAKVNSRTGNNSRKGPV